MAPDDELLAAREISGAGSAARAPAIRTTQARTARPGAAALFAVTAAWALAACSDDPPTGPPPPSPTDGLAAEEVASGLSAPVHLAAPPDDPRLFVVERRGTILVVEDGAVREEPFLDIRDRVTAGGEQGLLSVAFHPDFAATGELFVYYTDGTGDTRVERYTAGPDREEADPATAEPILSVEQPFSNHNGGLVVFGPDGMLYVGLGDGGGAGDPGENGQDPSNLLGTLLRIDVDGGEPYAVPPDNPFVGDPEGRDEIWAWGLRNPWRYAFDDPEGILYIADVGQDRREEVNAEPADAGGLNYGWNVMEGSLCFDPPEDCDRTGLILPVLEYGHDEGCSITGGHVYRGAAMPELAGHYFYGDFCAGWVRSFRLADGEPTEEREWELGELGSITSFGLDADGELYVLTLEGRVFRLVPEG